MPFKHTQVMMHGDRQDPKLPAASAKERLKLIEDLSRQLHQAQDLQRHPGWLQFVEACKYEELQVLAMLEKPIDPTTLAKLVGSQLILRSFQAWADDKAQELAVLLDELNQQEEQEVK